MTLEDTTWPDREVQGDIDRDKLREWLGRHGFPGGKNVCEASIVGSWEGPFLMVRVWYVNPATGRKMLLSGATDAEVAQEVRIVPLVCLPGEEVNESLDFSHVRVWAGRYGIGKRLRSIVGSHDCSFTFTEWHVEDGKIGLRATRVLGVPDWDGVGERASEALELVKDAAAGARA